MALVQAAVSSFRHGDRQPSWQPREWISRRTLLLTVLEHVRANGRLLIEPDPFAEVLGETLPKMEGDGREGEIVRVPDCWLAGAEDLIDAQIDARGSPSTLPRRHTLLW